MLKSCIQVIRLVVAFAALSVCSLVGGNVAGYEAAGGGDTGVRDTEQEGSGDAPDPFEASYAAQREPVGLSRPAP
jgi:hypothetical protein